MTTAVFSDLYLFFPTFLSDKRDMQFTARMGTPSTGSRLYRVAWSGIIEYEGLFLIASPDIDDTKDKTWQ